MGLQFRYLYPSFFLAWVVMQCEFWQKPIEAFIGFFYWLAISLEWFQRFPLKGNRLNWIRQKRNTLKSGDVPNFDLSSNFFLGSKLKKDRTRLTTIYLFLCGGSLFRVHSVRFYYYFMKYHSVLFLLLFQHLIVF